MWWSASNHFLLISVVVGCAETVTTFGFDDLVDATLATPHKQTTHTMMKMTIGIAIITITATTDPMITPVVEVPPLSGCIGSGCETAHKNGVLSWQSNDNTCHAVHVEDMLN